jgi:hypothetical protein
MVTFELKAYRQTNTNEIHLALIKGNGTRTTLYLYVFILPVLQGIFSVPAGAIADPSCMVPWK